MKEFIEPARRVAEQIVDVATKSQAVKAELESTTSKLTGINARLVTATEAVLAIAAEYDQAYEDAKPIEAAVDSNAATAEKLYGLLRVALQASENPHAKEAVGILGALASGIGDSVADTRVSIESINDLTHESLAHAIKTQEEVAKQVHDDAMNSIALTAEEIGVQGTLAFAVQDALIAYLNDIA